MYVDAGRPLQEAVLRVHHVGVDVEAGGLANVAEHEVANIEGPTKPAPRPRVVHQVGNRHAGPGHVPVEFRRIDDFEGRAEVRRQMIGGPGAQPRRHDERIAGDDEVHDGDTRADDHDRRRQGIDNDDGRRGRGQERPHAVEPDADVEVPRGEVEGEVEMALCFRELAATKVVVAKVENGVQHALLDLDLRRPTEGGRRRWCIQRGRQRQAFQLLQPEVADGRGRSFDHQGRRRGQVLGGGRFRRRRQRRIDGRRRRQPLHLLHTLQLERQLLLIVHQKLLGQVAQQGHHLFRVAADTLPVCTTRPVRTSTSRALTVMPPSG